MVWSCRRIIKHVWVRQEFFQIAVKAGTVGASGVPVLRTKYPIFSSVVIDIPMIVQHNSLISNILLQIIYKKFIKLTTI